MIDDLREKRLFRAYERWKREIADVNSRQFKNNLDWERSFATVDHEFAIAVDAVLRAVKQEVKNEK